MFYLKFCSAAATGVALLVCPVSGQAQDSPGKTIAVSPPAAAAQPNAGGSFSRSSPTSAILKISEVDPDVWAMLISSAAPSGDQAGADCIIGGRGALAEGRIVFTAGPIGGGNPDAEVTVTIEGDVATVNGAAAQRYCAVGSDLSGVYRREHFADPSRLNQESAEPRPETPPAKVPPTTAK